MARAGKKSDEIYNARRRYYRSAQRHLKQSYTMSGVAAERERALAKREFEKALDTYNPDQRQNISNAMRTLGAEFGIDIEGQRKRRGKDLTDTQIKREREKYLERIKTLKKESFESLSLSTTPEQRREREAKILLQDQSIAQRIFGGTVDIWRKEATIQVGVDKQTGEPIYKVDREKIFPALFKHYKVDNLPDLLEAIEKEVPMLYSMDGDDVYRIVKLTLQKGNVKSFVA